jgi:hypothetical protein
LHENLKSLLKIAFEMFFRGLAIQLPNPILPNIWESIPQTHQRV